MMRTWKLPGLSILAALILATLAPAGGQPPAGPKKLEQQVEALDQKLKGLVDNLVQDLKRIDEALQGHDKRLNNLEANDKDTSLKLDGARLRLERLGKVVEKLRLDMETLQKRTSGVAFYPPTDKTGLDEIRAQLRQIEQTLNRMQANGERTVFSPPVSRAGRILLVNQYPEMLLFVINQKSYRVLPGQTVTLDNMPAGNFTYEVFPGPPGSRTRTLEPGETYTLTARP